MLQRRLWWSVLLVAACAAGCGDQVEESAPKVPPPGDPPPPERLGKSIDTSLSDLLGKPRSELAAMADDWTTRARVQEQARREGRLEFSLLPEARFPLVVPVLREASFAPGFGLSLPPYVAVGTADSEFALHLARYGDDDAARMMVAAGDEAALRRIGESRCGRSYPVEWTRLVGLMQHVAQVRVAQGEPEAATELVQLHRQLKGLLDPKAAAGPLGAALLPPGRQVLAQGAAAWRGAEHTAQLAGDIDAALAEWGEAPALTLAVTPGARRAEVGRTLRRPGKARVIVAPDPARAIDLLDLPFSSEGAQTVIVSFDGSDGLNKVLVTYRPGVAPIYPTPRTLAVEFEVRGVSGKDVKAPGLVGRAYPCGNFTCEAVIVSRGNPIGAFARFDAGPCTAATLPRDFGGANLDRGFEQNRLRLVPEQVGTTVRTDRPAALAQIKSPLVRVKPTLAVVERAGEQDVTGRVRLRFAGEGGTTLQEAALSLWAAGGTAAISGQEDESGGHLILSWEDGRTRLTLRWPYTTGEAMELDAEDMSGADVSRRAADAAVFDRRERQARLDAGTPLKRLPRYLDYATVQLGASEAAVQQGLPRGESVTKLKVPDGVMVLFTGEGSQKTTHIARQSLVRFGPNGKVAELRTRYAEGPSGANWMQALLTGLTRRHGVPAEGPGPWAQLWPDLPARKPAATLYRWQDDVSVMTCQRDAWGLELTLRDASGPDPAAESLAAPEYLPRGPAGDLALGATREEVMRAAGAKPQTLADGALVLAPRTSSLYDSLLVWFDGDRVTRVVARYTQAAPPKAKALDLTKQMSEAWGRDARAFGWPARMDVPEGQGLQGLGWHDGRTRVRLFWQEAENGPQRMYAEWKDLPR
jgi:hypothetical protein